jgi:aryl-alcohol dehydrogenase-like predicted oxidoreductase
MRLVRLGRNGPVSCMGMSGGYGHADDAESIAAIHAALEADITMLDIGDFYSAR